MKSNHLKQAIFDIFAILKTISSISKAFLPLVLIQNLIKATLPFVNIILSYLIIDGLISQQGKDVIMQYVYLLVILNLILGLLQALLTSIVNTKVEHINRVIQANIANKALTLDYSLLEQKETLDLLQRAKEGTNSHGGITSFCHVLGNMLNHFISLIYSIILLSSLFTIAPIVNPTMIEKIFNSPFITVFLFILLFFSIYINYKIIKRLTKMVYIFFERNIEYNRMFGYFIQLGNNYHYGKDIRIYNLSTVIDEEMSKANRAATEQIREYSKIDGKYRGLTELVNQAVILLTYIIVGIKAILGFISVGSILKFVSALTKFNTSLSGIIMSFTQLDLQRKYLNNYYTFLNLENKNYQGTLPIEKRDDFLYDIEFKNVSFHYPNNDEMILKNVSLKLQVGQKMAIVGKNGAGKTTFIKLLCRLYEPTEGEILLNGIDIRKYDYNEYIHILSVVFQDYRLFSFEVGQNVAAEMNFEEKKVWEVLEQAGVADRIRNMNDGLRTTIYQNEENGVEISGGEAQKIAIARALYKNAPFVILDEPTSALDPVSEYEIYSKFDKLVTNKTSIYISHRMSSCRFCDHIIVFDKGQIIQSGDHPSLIKEVDGLYHKLWTSQAKYYNL